MILGRGLLLSAIAALTWSDLSTAASLSARQRTRTSWTILAGGYTDKITTLKFDIAAGSVSVVGTGASGVNPSWLATHPTKPTVHYSTNEFDGGFISSFQSTDPSRVVTKVNTVSALGDAPAHLALIRGGSEIISMNYNSGDGASYTLSADGLSFSNPQKIGPFPPAPNNISHPHQVSEYGAEVFIPDLGADKVWRLSKASGSWAIAGFIGQPSGSGPRHIATKPGLVFVLHELSNTLISQLVPRVAANTINPTTISSLSVLPPNIPGAVTPGRFHAAELILSLDGQFLYASNRDTSATPDPRGDAIAIVRVGYNGSLTFVRHVFTGLQLLRGLSLSPDGKYLAAGGQAAGGVAIYEIVSAGSDLKQVARNTQGPAATGFTWLL